MEEEPFRQAILYQDSLYFWTASLPTKFQDEGWSLTGLSHFWGEAQGKECWRSLLRSQASHAWHWVPRLPSCWNPPAKRGFFEQKTVRHLPTKSRYPHLRPARAIKPLNTGAWTGMRSSKGLRDRDVNNMVTWPCQIHYQTAWKCFLSSVVACTSRAVV